MGSDPSAAVAAALLAALSEQTAAAVGAPTRLVTVSIDCAQETDGAAPGPVTVDIVRRTRALVFATADMDGRDGTAKAAASAIYRVAD
jgi:hypothetical protein